MVSDKFQRKMRSVAAEVMDPDEELRGAVAGQAAAGAIAQVGTHTGGAQLATAGSTLTGRTFNALAILTDRHVYLVRTPRFHAFRVSEVVLQAPVNSLDIVPQARARVRIGDYMLTYQVEMRGQVERFVALAAQVDGASVRQEQRRVSRPVPA
jgi:hypothetical protein